LLSLAVLIFAVPAAGQANKDKAVIYLGLSFNKSVMEDAQNGFLGIDLFAGKMVTNNLCLGLSGGFDMVHVYKYTVDSSPEEGGGDYTERLSVVPFAFKARYYFNLSRMVQINVHAGLGVYNTISRLGGNEVGGISGNVTEPGGSIGISLDYWFLLMNGVSFEFEWHAFMNPDEGKAMFKYWQVRVDYGIIKF
jgi:hypothetical protein